MPATAFVAQGRQSAYHPPFYSSSLHCPLQKQASQAEELGEGARGTCGPQSRVLSFSRGTDDDTDPPDMRSFLLAWCRRLSMEAAGFADNLRCLSFTRNCMGRRGRLRLCSSPVVVPISGEQVCVKLDSYTWMCWRFTESDGRTLKEQAALVQFGHT